jgi:hypothetical protein
MLTQESGAERGAVTPLMLVILTIFFIFATSLMSWSLSERKIVLHKEEGNEALQVAEAGVDYYRWHLAHDETDYKDGKSWCCNNDDASTPETCGGVCGPYVTVYKDYNGNDIGEYRLRLRPAAIGSTIMRVESTGKIYKDASITKVITAKLGKRSLATYSLLSDSPVWIGDGETTSGPLHSNGGIRFDGECDSEVSSGVSTYDAGQAHHDASGEHPGIWGSADTDCQSFWSFPEPSVDFDLFTLDMAKIRTAAQGAAGIYLAPSGTEGYKLVFLVDGGVGRVDIYRVNSVSQRVKYYNEQNVLTTDFEGANQTTYLGRYALPSSGVIFVEDDVWVQGTVKGRVTVAATRFAETESQYARIIINDLLTYAARDGSNVLGLMAEGDILVPRHAPTYMTIDGVLLSQKGHVYRRIYQSNYVAQSIEVYGGMITDKFWTWTWVDGEGRYLDGYRETTAIYDNHVTYGPPPMFPTEENYDIVTWTER